jgi:hypothetical protein
MAPNTLIAYDAVNPPTTFQPTVRIFRQGLLLGISVRSALVRLVEGAPLSQGVDFPTPHFVFMDASIALMDRSSAGHFPSPQSVGCATDLSLPQDWNVIRLEPPSLIPRILGERNSGALSSEPFDMFGLNFQGVKRASVETGSTGDRMRQ